MKKSPFLTFLYTNVLCMPARYILRQRWSNQLIGCYLDTPHSARHITWFIKKYGIDMRESQHSNIKTYKTFNDFFIRKLKKSARSVDHEPHTLVSPADGYLMIKEQLKAGDTFLVKDRAFDLLHLLRDKQLADHYYGGTIMVIYLAPSDYHRFHAPCDALASKVVHIPGYYDSVNPQVYEVPVQPLVENERQLVLLKTKEFKQIMFIAVGAMAVGRIVMTYKAHRWMNKGDELGYFCFGASTIIMLFEPNTLRITGKTTHAVHRAQHVRMGQAMGVSTLNVLKE